MGQPAITVYTYNGVRYVPIIRTISTLFTSTSNGKRKIIGCRLPGQTNTMFCTVEEFIHHITIEPNGLKWKVPIENPEQYFEYIRGPLTLKRVEIMHEPANKRKAIEKLKSDPEVKRQAVLELLND